MALRLGTGADMSPGAFFLLTSGFAPLPHVDFAHCGSVEKVGVEPDPKRVGPASWNLEYG